MAGPKMNAIIWPEGFEPGFTDNFASNETIVTGLTAADVWPLLDTPSRWPTYYENATNVSIPEDNGPQLADGTRFSFETFGFTIESQCVEYVAPTATEPGRLAWNGWNKQFGLRVIDVVHAWLVEDLDGGRVRILTQESQKGVGARQMAATKPNPLVAQHQNWLAGLVKAARKEKEDQ
ncbi:hypothetical protein GQ53DRAFT_755720 [Thozetella sp. PMI_491]|nr:hypothetical protein GQ53DRAFT_755720 [Thozetella sp. PMI_491]